MLFTSLPFVVVFLPCALAGYFILGRMRLYEAAAAWLAVASLVFYAYDDVSRLLPIILISVAANFIVGRSLAQRPQKILLAAGVLGNIMALAHYKYANFIISLLFANAADAPIAQMPIGISFFTFTQIAFLVDAYRNNDQEYRPTYYLLFVTFFPHLIAGPILHHKDIIPQLEDKRAYRFSADGFIIGLTWFSAGLAKKVLLADMVAPFVSPAFAAASNGNAPSFVSAWIAALAYTMQIYFDFSGYSDMAVGLGLMFGIKLPANFASPYRAKSMIDFWRRWHMTLSRFLRDYLYFPLGGNRKGKGRRYVNLLITMIIGGLWHGAALTFVAWGAIHGLALAINHLWRDLTGGRPYVPSLLGQAMTMLVVVVAWVPFRADGFHATLLIWKAMFHLPTTMVLAIDGYQKQGLAMIMLCTVTALAAPNTQQILSYVNGSGRISSRLATSPRLYWAALAGLCFGMALTFSAVLEPAEFLYYRF